MTFKIKNSILNKDVLCLGILAITLSLLSACTNLQLLAVCAFVFFILSGKYRFKALKASFLATTLFTGAVLISYALFAYFKNIAFIDYVMHTALRAYTMSFCVFWFGYKCDIYKAFAFSKDFSFLLILTMSKIIRLQKLYFEFLEVLVARGAMHNKLSYEFLGSTITMFLAKSLEDGIENAEAMNMRGLDV